MTGVSEILLALATAALVAGGCASGTGTMQSHDAAAADGRTMIRVNNHNWSDMTVYLVRNGAKLRLGSVSSLDTRTFEVPTHLLISTGAVHLIADPIGSTRLFASPPVLIAPGQRAEWRLENSLAMSSFWIR